MGVRRKLNSNFLSGAIVVGLAVGWIFKSAALAIIVGTGLAAAMIHDGSIRLTKRSKKRGNRSH